MEFRIYYIRADNRWANYNNMKRAIIIMHLCVCEY